MRIPSADSDQIDHYFRAARNPSSIDPKRGDHFPQADFSLPILADARESARVMVDHIVPPYLALIESYDKAHAVQRTAEETKLEVSESGPME